MPLPQSGSALSAHAPFSFILFGASGHLAQLKIYPALYVLALKKRLPTNYAIIGFARTDMTDAAFRDLVSVSIRKEMIEVNEKVLAEMLAHVHYHSGQYDAEKDYAELSEKLRKIEKGTEGTKGTKGAKVEKWTRIAYLSVPPTVFTPILDGLCAARIHDSEDAGNFRCIIEKPVGHDLASFEQLQKKLLACFSEKEIYLLDHYLGKEAVRNIYYLRFANPVLERLFKNTLIHHVEVTASEPHGIEERAGYFEHTGTLRDMIQSHLLMMVSLLTMRLTEDMGSLRSHRLTALEQFYLPPAKNLGDVILQGQYAGGENKKGKLAAYRSEAQVAKDSRTNTFVAMKLRTRMSRWEGVPFVMRTGKRLDKKETRISIQFQEPHPVGQGSGPNCLDIILQGEAGMRLHLQTKLGGSEPQFRPLIMEDPLVCVGDCLPEHALLLLEAIHGNQQWFLTFDEVRTAWLLIDPLQSHLDDPKTPLLMYPAGSKGPKEMNEWIEKDGMKWF
ncbi:glucose-6-phosphate dehydrogenase [Candidatus Peregrinibacteria bacterium]|nr:glucose-6-phosphate dehydrogenase [Candidatus Peregrinibacteria bacterium]